jgi:hypothetical protein
VFHRQRFEPGSFEAAPRQHDGGALGVVSGLTVRFAHECGDHRVDVPLDIEAGFLLELVALGGGRLHLTESLPKLGVHDVAHVGVGNDRGVLRHVLQLVGPGGAGQ